MAAGTKASIVEAENVDRTDDGLPDAPNEAAQNPVNIGDRPHRRMGTATQSLLIYDDCHAQVFVCSLACRKPQKSRHFAVTQDCQLCMCREKKRRFSPGIRCRTSICCSMLRNSGRQDGNCGFLVGVDGWNESRLRLFFAHLDPING
jgi:hypothetical protein